MATQKKQKNKNRKIGRNANACKAYALSKRAEHNQVIRLKKRIARHPNDKVAQAALVRCKAFIGG
jgi:hypothetical protein